MVAEDAWLLLHGTPLTPAVWREVASRLRRERRVLCPSVTATGEPNMAHRVIARRLLAQVCDADVEFHVVGHSFGGQVALELTLEAPDRVRSLTMLCSRDTPFPAFRPAALALRRGMPVDIEAAMARWFRPDELAAGGWLVDYSRRCLRDADRMQWATALEAIAGYDRSDVVSRIQQPVTLIAAELDRVSTPASMSALAGRLRSAHLHVIPGAAHMTPLADPESLTRMLIDWSTP